MCEPSQRIKSRKLGDRSQRRGWLEIPSLTRSPRVAMKTRTSDWLGAGALFVRLRILAGCRQTSRLLPVSPKHRSRLFASFCRLFHVLPLLRTPEQIVEEPVWDHSFGHGLRRAILADDANRNMLAVLNGAALLLSASDAVMCDTLRRNKSKNARRSASKPYSYNSCGGSLRPPCRLAPHGTLV
jgi:hypothetical protein